MSNPVCISPLKFYDSLAKQSHRKSYAYGHISPLITKTGWIPPFQFVIPSHLYNDDSFYSVQIYDAKTNSLINDSVIAEKNVNFDSDGSIIESTGYSISPFIKISTDSRNNRFQYIRASYANTYVVCYDANKQFLMRGVYDSTNTLRAGTVYVRLSFETEDTGIEFIDKTNNSTVWNRAYLSLDYFSVISIENYKILVCNGKEKIVNAPEGLYYLKIASEKSVWTYYSEVFCFDNVTKDCLELEYWNETGNFAVKNGVIAFPADFHFKLLLKGEIGKPEYNFEEESTKRLGYIYVESQVSKKTYKFNAVVPEYICDALRLVRLCDNKIIRCKDDEYEAITFEMEAEWQTQGDLASVTCEFETDNVVANIGGFVPDKLGGDYNNDYNEDFDKE